MQMFRRLFIAAASAGLLSGLFVTLIHQVTTVPIILHAETFEKADDAGAPAMSDGAHEDAHDHGDGWEPRDGFERTAYTVLADLLTGIGFALLLVAGFAVTGIAVDWRSGFYWGLAGFAIFILAPGLGLPPEVPGTEAADLTARQIWWVGTVVATAAGLSLLLHWKPKSPLLYVLAVALIVVPHAIGAPQPDTYHSAAPESLAHRFIVATTIAGFLFWAALGSLSGYFYGRLAGRENAA